MPISISGGGGSDRPYIRFLPSVNAWVKGGPKGDKIEFEPKGANLIFDVEHMVLGWLTLGEGTRDWQPWPSHTKRTPSPGGEAKVGFSVDVYAPKLLGDEVYEFCANGTASTRFVEAIYNACEDGFGNGNVPLITITGTKAIKIGKGPTREIEWQLVKWVGRPQAMIDALGERASLLAADTKPASKFAAVETKRAGELVDEF